jgi:hypothetical protein
MRTVNDTRPAGTGTGLSWFLIPYLVLLLGVLMLVHVLQPDRGGSASSSRSPTHHQQQRV